jgi:dimethylamine--corrinoid protein Co-methyltransferase
MGGIRTAGDLVARMQITRAMRLTQAKEYVAGKLGVSTLDLSDPTVMFDVRKEFGLGGILESGEVTDVDDPIGIEAKFNIAAVLDVPVSCVERFRTKAGRRGRLGV